MAVFQFGFGSLQSLRSYFVIFAKPKTDSAEIKTHKLKLQENLCETSREELLERFPGEFLELQCQYLREKYQKEHKRRPTRKLGRNSRNISREQSFQEFQKNLGGIPGRKKLVMRMHFSMIWCGRRRNEICGWEEMTQRRKLNLKQHRQFCIYFCFFFFI